MGNKLIHLNIRNTFFALIKMVFISYLLVGCGDGSQSQSKSLTYEDLNYCAYIENNKNLFAFSNTGDWTQLFKTFYLKNNFSPNHSALKYIDSEIKNFDYDVSSPDLTFRTFMGLVPRWQERCRQIQIDPNY